MGKEKITDGKTKIKELTTKYGINKVLKGSRKDYEYNGYKITFNLIDELGAFLIVTGDGSQDEFIKKILEINNPEYITVPFNEPRLKTVDELILLY
ncbi:MAG: hypothetical protein AAB553_06125 [Patescibacteria group bacterium]